MSEPARTTTQAAGPDAKGPLPTGLWIGTGVFALLSAAALVVGMRIGRQAIEGSYAARIDKALENERADGEGKSEADQEAALASAGPFAAAKAGAAPAAGRRRQAVEHWNAGVRALQTGDAASARREFSRCLESDPDNADCRAGLARLDRR